MSADGPVRLRSNRDVIRWRRALATRRSLHLDVRRLDHWPPLRDLRLLAGAQGLGRELILGCHLKPLTFELLLHAGIVQRFHGSGIELGDDRLWRALRHP